MRPRGLSWRIGLAFAVLAAATWIAIGGALFLVLRTLHADGTRVNLTDVATPLVAQARDQLGTAGDVRTVLANLRDQVTEQGYSVYIVTANGGVLAVDGDPVPSDAIRIPAAAGRAATFDGSFRVAGQPYAWVAVVLRNPAGIGPRALVLATPDRSGADALRDLLQTLPAVVIVSLLVGAPIAWLISRSVTTPLRRLAQATADLPTDPAAQRQPLPLNGPTEVRDLTARFNAMADELQRTREEESAMLANLRHDLRTPVTVISGFAEALTDGTATGDDVGRAARAIQQESQRLEDLVGQLGAVERLESGEAGLRPEAIDATQLLQQAWERFGQSARAEGVELVVLPPQPGPGGTPLVVTADRMAVDRILGNLIGNAVAAITAAGPAAPVPTGAALPPISGHVWLAVTNVAGGPSAGGSIAIQVTDDGPGFPPGAAGRVFERFYRGDPSRAQAGGGSGLGLTIVRELARAHGGEAVAENMAPHGARVSVLLPLAPTLQVGSRATAAPAARQPERA